MHLYMHKHTYTAGIMKMDYDINYTIRIFGTFPPVISMAESIPELIKLYLNELFKPGT